MMHRRLLAFTLSAAVVAQSSTPPDRLGDLKELVRAIRVVEDRLRSIEIETARVMTNADGAPAGDVRMRLTREATPGGRFHAHLCPEILPHADGSFVECELFESWNGTLGISYTASQGRAGVPLHSVRRARATAEAPGRWHAHMASSAWLASIFGVLEADRVRLSDALEDAAGACRIHRRQDCINVSVTQEETTWEFDIVIRQFGPALRAHRRLDGSKLFRDITVTKFREIAPGIDYPEQCEFIDHSGSGTGARSRVEVLSARANVPLSGGTFVVDLPPGARVTDVTGKTTTVGVSPEELESAIDGSILAARRGLSAPRRPHDGWTLGRYFWMSVVGLGLVAVWRMFARHPAPSLAALFAIALATSSRAQWNAVWTQAVRTERLTNCGLNTCAFVAKWHASTQPLERLAEVLPLDSDWGNRTSLADIARALPRVDERFEVEAFKGISPRNLVDLLSPVGRSAVLHTEASGGHFVVALAADTDGVFFVDPLARAQWVSFESPKDAAFWHHLSGAGLIVKVREQVELPRLWTSRDLDVDVGHVPADGRHVTARRRVSNDGTGNPGLLLSTRGGCACLVAVRWVGVPPSAGGEGDVEFEFDSTKWPLGAISSSASIQVTSGAQIRDLTIRLRGQRGDNAAVPCSVIPKAVDFGTVDPDAQATSEVLVVLPAGKSIRSATTGSPLGVTCVGVESTLVGGASWVVLRHVVTLQAPKQGQRSGRWFGTLSFDTTDGTITVPVMAHLGARP